MAIHGNGQGAPAPSGVYAVGSGKQLFIDRLLIAKSQHVTLTLNPPVKTGERNVVSDFPWEDFYVGGWATIIEDEGIYKMWYDAASWTKAGGPLDSGRFQCYATSHDGIHWEKPILGLTKFAGSNQNNIVISDTTGTVFLDPNKSGGERFKYTGWWHEPDSPGLWLLSSPDGLHWKPYIDHPILTKGQFDTQNQIFWDDRINKYVVYVRRWAPLRKVGRSETSDLLHWPEPEIVFSYDSQDPVESDHYNSDVIKYPFAPNVYLMFPSAYYHYPASANDGPLDIQLATSRDGVHWQRLDRRPYVRLGPTGSDDGGSIYMAVGMLQKGNEIWMYFTGFDFTHGAYSRETKHKGVISRLVQRMDGFISADADFGGGELTTVPITFKGSHLVLNLDTGALGSAQIEILDAQGRPLPGFRARDCDRINANSISRVVTWKGKNDVSALSGKVLQIRFVMRSTKLYAFQFQP
jgi:hypothetical protein